MICFSNSVKNHVAIINPTNPWARQAFQWAALYHHFCYCSLGFCRPYYQFIGSVFVPWINHLICCFVLIAGSIGMTSLSCFNIFIIILLNSFPGSTSRQFPLHVNIIGLMEWKSWLPRLSFSLEYLLWLRIYRKKKIEN